ncbi:MAG: hypothetical protein ACRD9R_00825 [Pyrinomonadaceae bacterium]
MELDFFLRLMYLKLLKVGRDQSSSLALLTATKTLRFLEMKHQHKHLPTPQTLSGWQELRDAKKYLIARTLILSASRFVRMSQ